MPLKRILLVLLGGIAAASSALRAATPSDFKRQLEGSPVEWHAWDAGTLHDAAASGRPVYVFIGTFLSELSRATCRQTLSNPDAAALLNANFFCIAVDREEQPEVAALAQHYLRTVLQADGWPVHVWFTPEMQPFDGAGYLPPTEEWGKPGFLKVAQRVADAWKTNAAACRARGAQAVAALAKPFPFPSGASPVENPRGRLTTAADTWRGLFDATNGGFGDPPKSPKPELLRFLLRQTEADRQAALATLRAIAASPMHDPLDGGFFRSASDAAWKIPYPQKALADEALLALAYLDATQIADDPVFPAAARDALDYTLTRLAHPDGTFAAAEDGTGDDAATYFAWTEAEIDAALGPDAAAYKQAHGVTAAGNVSEEDDITGRLKGRNLLRPAASRTAADTRLAARLLAVRDARPALTRDERATAGAHGLLLAALARAGTQLKEPRYTQAAAALFAVLQKTFVVSSHGELRRLAGSASAATAADYAAVALGCRELAKSDSATKAADLADRLLAAARAAYFEPAAGRYMAVPAELPVGFVVRPPTLAETPSAEALALLAGIPPSDARAVTASLLGQMAATDAPPPGDVLLALSPTP